MVSDSGNAAVGKGRLSRTQRQALGVVIDFPWVTVVARIVMVAFGTAATLIFLLTNRLHDDPVD